MQCTWYGVHVFQSGVPLRAFCFVSLFSDNLLEEYNSTTTIITVELRRVRKRNYRKGARRKPKSNQGSKTHRQDKRQ